MAIPLPGVWGKMWGHKVVCVTSTATSFWVTSTIKEEGRRERGWSNLKEERKARRIVQKRKKMKKKEEDEEVKAKRMKKRRTAAST